jgi:nicotinate-nucleotide pyrophosphorylase (carboxylating)
MNYYRDFDFKTADNLIKLALEEDKGTGDVTSDMLIPRSNNSIAEILLKEPCIVAGTEIVKRVFAVIDKKVRVAFFIREGEHIEGRQVIGEVSGNTRSILLGERLALNLMQRMSGVATYTDQFRRKLGNDSIRIIDTRKTTPNIRIFEKLAVLIGGGANHRMGLYDMMLIKDNHIEANGGIENTLKKLKKVKSTITVPVEIEVKNIDELKIVAANGVGLVDRIMLDNFPVGKLNEAVKIIAGRFECEVSGGVNLYNISKYRRLKGIDFISIGALTHSAKSVDISLDFIT